MPGFWVGEPYTTGKRECRETAPGAGTWWDERNCDWQETDEQGQPIGPPEPKLFDWQNSGEACVP